MNHAPGQLTFTWRRDDDVESAMATSPGWDWEVADETADPPMTELVQPR